MVPGNLQKMNEATVIARAAKGDGEARQFLEHVSAAGLHLHERTGVVVEVVVAVFWHVVLDRRGGGDSRRAATRP